MRWIHDRLDRLDDRRARRLRSTLGLRRWLVSWHRIGEGEHGVGEGDGLWLARLSCPSLASTLERTGKTRTQAIERAARSLTLLMALHGKINRRTARPGRDDESSDDNRP